MTNDRLREEVGEISLVPLEDRISAPIMAAFTHLNHDGSRFTDGTYGVYYAAKSIDTAIAETQFGMGRRSSPFTRSNSTPKEVSVSDWFLFSCRA